jgi:hypothetical protein
MSALAEVVDESITGMSRTMVTKAEQEKVIIYTQSHSRGNPIAETISCHISAALYPKSRLCSTQVGATITREERPNFDEARE